MPNPKKVVANSSVMISNRIKKLSALRRTASPIAAFAAAALCLAGSLGICAASVTFDDFNVSVGHFSSPYNGSGSTINLASTSTFPRVTTNNPLEGSGQQQLNINCVTNGGTTRFRHLSGGGTPANNVAFTTAAGVNGWIGFYIKAPVGTDPNWNVQLYLEGASNNGGVPKTIICDGTFHLYEWNLDDTSGGADGWGSVASIITGSATVSAGSHTIDSILFRNSAAPLSSTFYLDFVAKSDSGSVSNLLAAPCLSTSPVGVTGPISTNSNTVIVTSASASATQLTVYQNTGAGLVAIGAKTNGITAGNNNVTVSNLVKTALVGATQTISNQESCLPTSANSLLVGGGANPRIRVDYSIRETSSTGPVGAAGDTSSSNIHFLGSTGVNGGAPAGGRVINVSTNWQTVTLQRGNVTIADSGNVSGAPVAGTGYAANDTVGLQVFPFKNSVNGKVYSPDASQTASDVTSNNLFSINFTWNAVAGADGYRVLRNHNAAGYGEFLDITGSNTLSDNNVGWASGSDVALKSGQVDSSVQWFPSTSNTNALPGQWGILEAIAFAIDDLSDTGPYDFYIDNIMSGTNVVQNFEGALAGTASVAFQLPGFSPSTSGSLLPAPNEGDVSNGAADTGTKSLHVRFQWSGTNSTKWLRLTTSGLGNPQVFLNDPITMRILLLPVNDSPIAPAGPTLTATPSGSSVILNWTGTHRLLESSNVSGPYVTNTATTVAPYTTNSPAETQKYYRLRD